ncbi:phosphoribosyltransferase family protein [Flaviaesturariibacter aridisoli]|uniref:Phosphoribosyltransferase n=1 Tax=Flaviaesturariibacter aridisoli TaxID=2545761 RepID=A0A4R4E365_9BACT|nr:phosphoribosyltransferase family protein [Flaviaesturariibacter aridisoli]TCZ73849.1 phosphoribosyltransferase [Flaviaesturariibacter aridisoli]
MAADIAAKNSILSADAATRRIRRMAFEVAEQHVDAESLVLLGIEGNGTIVATQLAQELATILPVPVTTGTVRINKKAPLDARLDPAIPLEGRVVLLVDDVSNTGKTLLYALRPLLEFQPRAIRTLVLVERAHKLFAVQPDFVGLSVSTTLQEHITVETDGQTITGAFLH